MAYNCTIPLSIVLKLHWVNSSSFPQAVKLFASWPLGVTTIKPTHTRKHVCRKLPGLQHAVQVSSSRGAVVSTCFNFIHITGTFVGMFRQHLPRPKQFDNLTNQTQKTKTKPKCNLFQQNTWKARYGWPWQQRRDLYHAVHSPPLGTHLPVDSGNPEQTFF